MKIRVEWTENTRRAAEIEAPSIAVVRANWAEQYGSEMVDQLENDSVEVDGGIDWDSATFTEVRR